MVNIEKLKGLMKQLDEIEAKRVILMCEIDKLYMNPNSKHLLRSHDLEPKQTIIKYRAPGTMPTVAGTIPTVDIDAVHRTHHSAGKNAKLSRSMKKHWTTYRRNKFSKKQKKRWAAMPQEERDRRVNCMKVGRGIVPQTTQAAI